MKKLISLLLAFLLVLPMGACTTQEGGENVANITFEFTEIGITYTKFRVNVKGPVEGTNYFKVWVFPKGTGYDEANPNYTSTEHSALSSTGSYTGVSVSYSNLLPNTVYEAYVVLYVDGEKTSVTASMSFRTSVGEQKYGDYTLLGDIEYNIGAYPYRAIQKGSGINNFVLYVSDTPLIVKTMVISGTTYEYLCSVAPYAVQTFRNSDDYWSVSDFFTDTEEDKTHPATNRGYPMVWSNHDILWDDGSVFFKAGPQPILANSKLQMNIAQETVPGAKLTWDVSGGAPETVTLDDTTYYKMYAKYLSYDELCSATLVLSVDGTVVETVTVSEIGVTQVTDGLITAGEGAVLSISDEFAQTVGLSEGIWWTSDFTTMGASTFDLYYAGYCDRITSFSATLDLTCADLLQTDSVYRIKAWVYKKADGLDTTQTPTWTSELFAGPTHSESYTFTGLTPATDYAVYGVIWLETDGAASEHNATATFTTLEGEATEAPDFSGAALEVAYTEVTTDSAYLEVNFAGIPQGDELYTYLDCTLDDGTEATDNPILIDNPPSDNVSGVTEVRFANLEPDTEYTATFKLVYQLYGETGYTDPGVEITTTFTTAKDGGFDRDSFLLGMASGLGCTAATKSDAEYNSWMQGYIVGDELRKAITS